MALRLIVNADDLGMTPGVTKGIAESMSGGIVSSTSLMVNMPAAPEAAALAMSQQLPVGLHLNLTTGRPVSPPEAIGSLVRRDGSFYAYSQFLRRLMTLKISVHDIYRELAAQIEAARRMGLQPTHIDTHHHLHLWWPVTWALLRAGRRYGIDRTRTTRTADMAVRTATRSTAFGGWAKRRYKAITAALLGRWFRMPTWRMDPSAFTAGAGADGRSPLDEWLALVRELAKLHGDLVVEVPCHPGYVDNELRGYARYVAGREQEIFALTSPQLKKAVSRAGIELISFRDL